MQETAEDIFLTAGKDGDSESSFESSEIDYAESEWNSFDFDKLKLSFHDGSQEVGVFHEQSLTSRKRLAEKTRTVGGMVSKVDNIVLKDSIGSLLKIYQKEIDSLTIRSKFSEKLILKTSRLLSELNSPSIQLMQLTEKISKYKIRNKELKSKLENHQIELSKDIEDKADFEEMLENEVKERSKSILRVHEKEKTLLKRKYEENLTKISQERENISTELSEVRSEVLNLRTKNETLRRSNEKEIENNNEIKQLERQIMTLTVDKSAVDAKLLELNRTFETFKSESEFSLKKKDKELETCQENRNLNITKDMNDNTKQQACLLRILETLKNGDEDEIDQIDMEVEQKIFKLIKELKSKTIELKILSENKILEVKENDKKIFELKERLLDQEALTKRIEIELFALSSVSQNGSFVFNKNEINQKSTQQQTQSQTQTQTEKATKKMLATVSSQRDRLRTSLQVSEAEVEKIRKELRLKTQKEMALKDDNLKLYQRIKFLESYKQSERSTLFVDLEENFSPKTQMKKGLGKGVEHKYRKVYEDIDNDKGGWKSFQSKEKQRLSNKTTFIDQVSLKLFYPFLEKRKGRVFLVYYTIFVHFALLLLLFSVLF